MRNLYRAVLTCALTMTVGLSAPAVARAAVPAGFPGGLPSVDQLRQALLTVADVPAGLTLVDSGSGETDDSDFAVWDRCTDSRDPEKPVTFANVEFGTEGRGEDASVSLMIGATGAENARAIVTANAKEADGCPGVDVAEQPYVREPMPAFGDASLGVTFRSGSSERPRAMVLAQGDVVAYLVTTGLDRPAFLALAKKCADRVARHFR